MDFWVCSNVWANFGSTEEQTATNMFRSLLITYNQIMHIMQLIFFLPLVHNAKMKWNFIKFINNPSSFNIYIYIYIGKEDSFKILEKGVTQGLPYNFDSIMQMHHRFYSKNRKKLSTIIPVNDSIPKKMLGSSHPNQQDYLDINLTYCGEIKHLFNVIMQAKLESNITNVYSGYKTWFS